jgi:hypothetical protein
MDFIFLTKHVSYIEVSYQNYLHKPWTKLRDESNRIYDRMIREWSLK